MSYNHNKPFLFSFCFTLINCIRTCRYILDGDREELRSIRSELSSLRSFAAVNSPINTRNQESVRPSVGKNNMDLLQRLHQEKRDLMSSGLYEENDSLIAELNRSILEASADTGGLADRRYLGLSSSARN